MKRVLKFPTGSDIPDGAIYLCTIRNGNISIREQRMHVWHYFLVEVNEDEEI